jgi:uncharacterized membrane protein
MRDLKFHHLTIPIAAAMVAVGLALIAAPIRFGILETLGPDLVLAIVFGVFTIASYGVVRAVEWADRRVTHEERNENERFR